MLERYNFKSKVIKRNKGGEKLYTREGIKMLADIIKAAAGGA
jgi:hypothetical protein